MSNASPHVAVIGGGIFGVSSAVHLVRRGATVTLLTEGEFASGASGRSLAWLNSAGRRSRPYHDLRMAGIDRWRTWAHRTPGSAAAVHFDGGLTWAPEGESYRERYVFERDLGYDSRWLMPDEVAAIAPGVDASKVAEEGAIFNAGEAWVDLPSVLRLLLSELREAGATILEHSGRCKVVVENGRAVGAITASGERVKADAVVLAAGPDTPAQLAELGVHIGNDSPVAFVAFTKPVDSPLRAVLNTPNVAIRRTVDGGLAMDSAWSEESIEFGADGEPRIADEVVERLLREGSEVIEGHPVLELDHLGIGYKPIPGGGEPVVGGIDGVPGLYTAFSHSGATLGLLVGELIAEEILDGRIPALLQSFRASRYSGGVA